MTLPHRAVLGAAAAAFCLAAILNCGGYRYGIGDQAFYVPAVVQHLNPTLFPRDRAMLHAQDRFMLYDDAAAVVVRATGVSLPALFLAAYIAGMTLLFGAIVAIGRVTYRSWWTVALLAALMTLRHRITQTGANTLEAYFQPRMIAFALGAWAIAFYLRGKGPFAIALVASAFAIHPTTALWFAIWIVVALAVSEPRWRIPLIAAGTAAGLAALWTVIAGPLRGHLDRMDPFWASAMAGKDYIFPSDWNASFWLVNLSYLPVAGAIYVMRRRRGVALPREAGLLRGAAALVAVFLVSWPLMVTGIALALQLQTSRIFWMLDLLAAIYLAWLLGEAPRSAMVRRAVVAGFIAIAISRGVFVWRVEHAGNPVIRPGLPQDNWTDAMNWISKTLRTRTCWRRPGTHGSTERASGYPASATYISKRSRTWRSRSIRATPQSGRSSAFGKGRISTRSRPPSSARSRPDTTSTISSVIATIALPLAYRNQQFRVYTLQDSTVPGTGNERAPFIPNPDGEGATG